MTSQKYNINLEAKLALRDLITALGKEDPDMIERIGSFAMSEKDTEEFGQSVIEEISDNLGKSFFELAVESIREEHREALAIVEDDRRRYFRGGVRMISEAQTVKEISLWLLQSDSPITRAAVEIQTLRMALHQVTGENKSQRELLRTIVKVAQIGDPLKPETGEALPPNVVEALLKS